MSYEVRPYQTKAEQDVYDAWGSGLKNVLLRLDTGAGKTYIASKLFKKQKGASVLIAHRQELVGQLSMALAEQGVYHNLIASRKVVQFISSHHVRILGQSFFHPQAPTAVAGVKTLLRRDLGSWRHQVILWGMDEGHHVLRENEWGKAVALFPNALGFGMTATPGRADGKGVGRHAHGVFDHMVEGPTMRELMALGNLTDYRLFGPPSDMDLTNVNISKATGDYNPNQLRDASHKSHIVGDVVDQYLRIAAGKLGITFAVDIETATDIAARYRQMGVPAEVISSKTPAHLRVELMERFKRGELKNLVNVDLFGEGTDVPAIEVVSMARPTQSLPLYMQQFGRGLRPIAGKEKAFIIDHVRNHERHGLPDAPRTWSLDARERGVRGKKDDTITPTTACEKCMSVYERVLVACPFCKHRPEPKGRARPEQVEGNLFELTPEALAELRGEIAVAQEPPEVMKDRLTAGGLAPIVVNSQVKLKREQHESLTTLIEQINWWGAHRKAEGISEEESYKRFFYRFGVDVMTAQTLKRNDADELTSKIKDDMS